MKKKKFNKFDTIALANSCLQIQFSHNTETEPCNVERVYGYWIRTHLYWYMILFGEKIKAIDESVNEANTIRKFNTNNGFREKKSRKLQVFHPKMFHIRVIFS